MINCLEKGEHQGFGRLQYFHEYVIMNVVKHIIACCVGLHQNYSCFMFSVPTSQVVDVKLKSILGIDYVLVL